MASGIEQLIAAELPAASGGDRAAYGRIVAACQNTVTAVALAITGDVPASEDIAQETFLSAWQHLKRLQNPSSFLPWLRQIARNLARDHLRASRHRPLDGEGAEIAIELAADPSPTPMQQIVEDERERAAAELISALPEDSREVLLLYYREGQSSLQVAALLGMTDAAVRKRLSRARQSLQADLLARFGEFASHSAPGAAFTAIIATALTTAAPPVAAKTLLTIGAVGGAKTLGNIVFGAAGSIGFALLAAFAGIWLGVRKQLKGSIDDEERRGLIRSAAISSMATVAFLIGAIFVARYDDSWILPVLATIVFMSIIFYQTLVVQPRVLARRHAQEALRNPILAAKMRRREQLQCWFGFGIGLICGLGGLIVGLISSGRL